MSDFIRKRYIDDVLIHESRRQKRSLSTTSHANLPDGTIKTNSPTDCNMKEHFNITMDILAFRKLAILSCQNLTQAISNDIDPFFNATNDALNFIHNLESNWTLAWKQHVLQIEDEIKRLGDKYAFRHAIFDENWSAMEEPSMQVPSDDEIPLSVLCVKRPSLEKPENQLASDKVLLTSQKVPSDRQISSEISLQPNYNNSPDNSQEPLLLAKNDIKVEMDNDAVLNEIPDHDSLSAENISLNLSRTGPVTGPKASVLRMIVKDSQDNQHIVSKHYVQAEECYVSIPLSEKKPVDEYQRKRPNAPQPSKTRDSDDSTSSGNIWQPSRLQRHRSKTRKTRRVSSSHSSSATLTCSTPSYSGSSNACLWETVECELGGEAFQGGFLFFVVIKHFLWFYENQM